ncbi:MAG: hypothetical protein HYW57_03460 [Ignavibacteriales bacterium]|nr:hypothetical protein [Ignavibacteriales bacterium]
MDIKTLLQSLLDHSVKFLVIGAWALPAYGYERPTRDIDIFIEPTEKNARNVLKALLAIGYDGVQDLSLDQILKKKILFRQFILQTDVHPFVKGTTFEHAWESRVETEIKGLRVFVPSFETLLSMKRAVNRERDQEDVRQLEARRKAFGTEQNPQ